MTTNLVCPFGILPPPPCPGLWTERRFGDMPLFAINACVGNVRGHVSNNLWYPVYLLLPICKLYKDISHVYTTLPGRHWSDPGLPEPCLPAQIFLLSVPHTGLMHPWTAAATATPQAYLLLK